MATVMMNIDDIVTKPREIIFRKKAEHVIENLKKRNINGIYCRGTKDAVTEICRLIPERASVALGGSVTIMQSGLLDALRGMNIELLDRSIERIAHQEDITPRKINHWRRTGMLANQFIERRFHAFRLNPPGWLDRADEYPPPTA
jgi:hypothetical protein